MGLFRKAAVIGGLVAFARSRQGQELTTKAKTYLSDPRTQQKIADLKTRITGAR